MFSDVPNLRLAGQENYRVTSSSLSDHPYLLRSGSLKNITPQSLFSLKHDLGLQCQIDLMSVNEADHSSYHQLCMDYGIERRHFPIDENASGFKEKLHPTFNDYYEHYYAILTQNSADFVDIVEFIAESEYQRFLISCYAGKDRTGVIIFLVFSLLDIDIDSILKDYVLSGSYLLPHIDEFKSNWQKRGLDKADYKSRLLPDERTLVCLLARITKEFGSVSEYLFTHGLSRKIVRKLKTKFYPYQA